MLDGFSGYNQIPMAKQNQLKTYFITEWEPFTYRVKPFGLKKYTNNRAIMQAFAKYLNDFMQVF
jgi:hypothetical protein